MSEKKHILDYYLDNTPSDDDEYERGCLLTFGIVAIIFISLAVGIYFIYE